MENPTPAPEPTPTPTPEPETAPETVQPASAEQAPPATESKPEEITDPLLQLARAAKAARLSPADEEKAVTLLKERLAGGRAGITAAIEPMTDGLPWVVSVNAVSAVWEALSLPMRRHLVASIAKTETEPARRLRLSLARAVFKIDPPAGLKQAAGAVAALKDPETGAFSSKHRQYFFNIFIGKGKPWLLQLPLGDLKGADAEALTHAALETLSFCPPPSQLSVVRWIHGAGRFKKISPGDLALAAKAVGRWNVKLQRQLKADIADLPPELEAVLKPEALQAAPEKPATPTSAPEPAAAPEAAQAAPTAEAPAGEEPAPAEAPAEGAPAPEEHPREKKPRYEPERRNGDRDHGERPKQQEPPEIRRERGEKPGRPFDVKEALRGVESYIANLRNDLEQAKAQLRRQEKDDRRSRPARNEPPPPAEEIEALRRHNIRLESTVAELRAQLEDLASHHEAVAESRMLHTEAPISEGAAEALKSLLSIKLQEAFETYHAMRLEPLDKVFRLDYRDLLGSVFDVLLAEGVQLKKEPKKP